MRKEDVCVIKHVNIAAGIIRNSQRQIFITQRDASSHMAGFWEFPGGKIEVGETAVEALIRELGEETGIIARSPQPLQTLKHCFSDRILCLSFFLVENWQGEPYGKEGQPMRWVGQDQLVAEEFPPANKQIIDLLRLGEI
jgi:8-oxo-dGTP diphosphatase